MQGCLVSCLVGYSHRLAAADVCGGASVVDNLPNILFGLLVSTWSVLVPLQGSVCGVGQTDVVRCMDTP